MVRSKTLIPIIPNIMKKNDNNSRRKFLNNGIKIGLATAIGGIGLTKIASKLNAKTNPESGSKMELMTTDGTIVQVDSAEVVEMTHSAKKDDTYNEREGIPNRKFVMVVDLAKCKNALKCVSACNKHHYVTGDNAWLKVHKMQESKDTASYWMPRTCMHCDQPACLCNSLPCRCYI